MLGEYPRITLPEVERLLTNEVDVQEFGPMGFNPGHRQHVHRSVPLRVGIAVAVGSGATLLASLVLLPAARGRTTVGSVPTPCLGERSDLTFDSSVVASGELADKLEALELKYQGIAGYRALIIDQSETVYLIVDHPADGDLTSSATSDGIHVLSSCVSSTDLDRDLNETRAVLTSMTQSPDDYWSVGYTPFGDKILISTSLPELEVRDGLKQADVRTPIDFYQGQEGELGRNILTRR